MSKPTERLYSELQAVLERYAEEDVTFAEAIGILQLLSTGLAIEVRKAIGADSSDPDDDDESWPSAQDWEGM